MRVDTGYATPDGRYVVPDCSAGSKLENPGLVEQGPFVFEEEG